MYLQFSQLYFSKLYLTKIQIISLTVLYPKTTLLKIIENIPPTAVNGISSVLYQRLMLVEKVWGIHLLRWLKPL